jgi:iron-sulfur cluster assembly protein
MITEETSLSEVLDSRPGAVEVLRSFDMTLGCNVDVSGSLKEAATSQGVDFKVLVEKLNKIEIKEEEPGEVNVSLTEKAAEKMNELNDEKKEGLRFGVSPGGCAGYTYSMEFGSKKEGDIELEDKGIRVFVEKTSANKVNGVSIDYVESLEMSGFKVNNPNATATCGCGKSASV